MAPLVSVNSRETVGGRRCTSGVSSSLNSIDHQVMGGAPCIVGTRIPVATIVSMLAEGSSVSEVLADFPQLTAVAVSAALQFAADAVRDRELPLPA